MTLNAPPDKAALLRELRGGDPEEAVFGLPSNPLVEAIRAELEDNNTAVWFRSLAESGPEAIEAQGWQVKEVLEDRGKRHDLRDVQDAMLQLAHEIHGAEDPRLLMLRHVKAWVNRRPKVDQERYVAALEEGFPDHWEAPAAEFRKFLRGCCEKAMEKSVA